MIWSEGPCDTSCLTAALWSLHIWAEGPAIKGKCIQEASAEVFLQRSGGKARRVNERSECSQANECADIQNLQKVQKPQPRKDNVRVCNNRPRHFNKSWRSPQESWEWWKINILAVFLLPQPEKSGWCRPSTHTQAIKWNSLSLSFSLSLCFYFFLFLKLIWQYPWRLEVTL